MKLIFYRIFNYDVHEYKHGNDFMGIAIQSSQAMINARSENWPIHSGDDESPFVYGPGGYRFNLVDEQQPVDTGKSSSLCNQIFYVNNISAGVIIRSGQKGYIGMFRLEEILKVLGGLARNENL